jgi:hypothetical protein
MKFLKQKNISKYSITDQTLFTNHFGRAVMGLTGGLRLPQGTTAQRPQPTNVSLGGASGTVRYPGSASEFADGTIRYNIDTNSLEALIAGVWEVVRAPGATTITKQTLGPGNDVDVNFGPLTLTPSSPDNIIVLVENVMQISTTNYTLTSSNTVITFTSPVPTGKYVTVYFGYAN